MTNTYNRLVGRPVLVYTTRPHEDVPPALIGVLVHVDHDDGFITLECAPDKENAKLAAALGNPIHGWTVYLRQKHVVMLVPVAEEEYNATVRA